MSPATRPRALLLLAGICLCSGQTSPSPPTSRFVSTPDPSVTAPAHPENASTDGKCTGSEETHLQSLCQK